MFGWTHWFPFGWFGGIGMCGLIVVIILVIVFVTRGGRHDTREERHGSRAEEILKERLAKGEIDEETYEKLLSKIR